MAAVRKQVTALFADLVGSTAFGEQVDPEAARAALAPYFAILKSTIEDHAGTVAKFTGDGVMAMFGIPEIAEDDALRAVAAGLELQQRFRSFAESVRERHGIELGLRVGINTGELVTGADDADLVGDVLNTAARLEAACQPGRVMVGEDTWRLTRSAVTYEVLGEVRVKGKADALATFQVIDTGLETVEENIPFVGRAEELSTARAVFEDAVRSSSCQLATVIGAPGVGKTRLASELRSGIGARSFDLRFERRGSTTFTPIVDLLRELTGSASPEDVARLVADHAEADRLGTVLSSFLGHGDTRSTEESFWAVRRLLEHLAAADPLLIVVDDIQWAEPLFWDLLDHLAEWTAAPVMLLGLARPELRELRPELTQKGRRIAASIALEGLDANTTRELAARLLDTDELPIDLVDRLPTSTEGNPLFVRELVQMLVDDGVLARTGEHWHLTIDADAIEVPPTILSLLASRVERLPGDERQVVELASVIGTEFDRGLLGAIAGGDITARLGALIDRLRRKDLVEPSGTWAGDHPVYRFHHVLVRDAAYRRLLKGHRAELHERVGRYLDADGIESDENDVVVAFHYEQVHRYRSELGTVDDDTRSLARQATQRLRTAAEQALAREDLASSGTYAIRALALTDDDDERDELLAVGCEALLSSGDVARGAPLVEELLDRDLGDRLGAWADCFRAHLWSLTDSARLSQATDLAEDAATRLEALDDSAGVAKARLVRASTLARLGRVGDCEAELDLALGAARAAGDRRRTVAVLGAAPLAALWGPSPVARAGGRCLDVLRLLRITTSSPAVEATSIRCQGMLEAMRGRFDSAREKFETSRTTARDLGLRHGLYETELFEGFVDLLAGDPVAAEPHLILARDGLGALGIGADAGQATALLARALLRQGRLDEADELASQALRSAGENLQTAVASRSVLGEIRAEQGRPDEARQLIVEALQIVETTDITIDHAIAQRSAARVADRLGDADDARAHRAAAERLFADKGVTGLAETRPEHEVAATSEQSETDDGSDVQRAARLAPNAAWEVNEGLWSTWMAGDQSGYLALLAPDFRARIHELGPKLAFSGDRYATADVLFQSLADDRVHAAPNRLIAKRGDDLALIAMTFRDGASSTTMYTVSRVRDGRAVRADTFAEDQLGDALDELDRQWVELGGPTRLVEFGQQMRHANWSGNTDLLRRCLLPDWTFHDRRRLGVGAMTREQYISSSFAKRGGVTVVINEYLDHTDSAAITHDRFINPDGSEWEHLAVIAYEVDGGRSTDLFDLEDPAAARAHFAALDHRSLSGEFVDPDRLGAGRPENSASRAMTQFADAINERDVVGFGSMLHADYAHRNHQRLRVQDVLTRDEAVGMARSMMTGGSASFETIAVRDADLALGRLVTRFGPDVVSHITVLELRDGLIHEGATFDDDQLTAALADLDRRWVERGGPRAEIRNAIAFREAQHAGDVPAARRLLSADFVLTDHGELGFGRLGVDEHLATAVAGASGVVAIPVEYLDHSDTAALARIRFDAPDDSAWEYWVVTRIVDGLTRSVDLFGIDDLDAARARFQELAPDVGDEQFVFSNHAWEVARAFGNALITRDRTAAGNLLADTFESTSPERSGAGARLDREMFLTAMFDTHLADGELDVDQRLRATRGDTWCVWQLSATYGGDSIVERVCVGSARDGQIESTEWYEVADLPDAMDELDRRWTAGGGRADPVVAAVARSMSNGPFDAYADCFAPDFVCVDHRELGFGVRSRDEWLDSTGLLVGQVTTIGAQEYLAIDDGLSLSRVEMSSNIDGSVWPLWLIDQHDGERAVRWEEFPIDQRSRALARYHELTGAAEAVQRTPSNAATRLIEEHTAALNDGDLDRFLAAFHPEGRQELHQSLQVTEEIDIDGVEAVGRSIIAGQGVLTSEPVAVFGDRLAVCVQVLRFGPDEIRESSVVEVDCGLITRVVRFDDDQLVDALDTFARRAVELGRPAALANLEITIRGAHWRHDVEGFKQALDPSWAFHDHRRLGLGPMTREEYLASSFPVRPGEVLYWTVEVLAHTDSVWLAHDRWLTADGSGWDQLHVVDFRSGTTQTSDAFDLNDLDAARACYDERATAAAGVRTDQPTHSGHVPAGGPERGLPAFTNAAWEWTRASVHAVETSDRSRLLELMADDFVTIARYRMHVGQELGRNDFVENLLAQRADRVDARLDTELIAMRADDLALVRLEWFIDDNLMEYLVVVHVVDGLATLMVMFDETQLNDALDELDRLWGDNGAPTRWAAASIAYRRAWTDADVPALRRCFTDDFVSVDHRLLGLGTRTADEWAGSVLMLIDGLGVSVFVVRTAIEWSEHTQLVWNAFDTATDDSAFDMLAVAQIDDDGRFTRHELFDIDDLDGATARFRELVDTSHAAHARFDELAAEDPSNEPRTFSNRAWEVSREMIAAHNVGDRRRCASPLADDMVWVAHDPIMQFASPGSELDREAWLDVVFHGDLASAGHVSTGELIAVRGDTLCLNLTTATAANGDVSDRLYLIEIDADGRCTRIDSYRNDQLREAYDELDRRFLQTLSIEDLETVRRVRNGWYATDRAGIAPLLHPRFRLRDHRNLGWPNADRDALLEYAGTLPPGSYATVPEIFRVSDRAFVIRRVQFMAEGTASTDSVIAGSIGDGVFTTMDWYQPDDLDAALARFHELTSSSAPGVAQVANPGSETWAATVEAWSNDGLSAMRPLLHPDFRFDARRASIPSFGGDRDDYLSAISMFEDEGVADLTMEVVAVRGDRLALCEFVIITSAGDEFRLLNVGESADDGTAIRMTTFDTHQLDEALGELDRQWVELGGPAVAAARTRQVAKILSSGSHEGFSALFTAGFEVVDHRPVGLGARDRDEFLASTEVLVGTVTAWTAVVFETNDRATLTRVEMRSNENESASSLLLLTTYDGHLVGRWEQFAVDDVDAARERYHEVTGGLTDEETPSR